VIRGKRVADWLSGVPRDLWLSFGDSQRWWTRAIVAIALAGAYFIGENAHGFADWAVGIALVLVPFVQQLAASEFQSYAQEAGEQAIAEFWVTINNASAKMITALRAVLAQSRGQEKNRRRGQLQEAAVQSAFLACSGTVPHARAVFFRQDASGRRLRADTSAGRADESRRVFEKSADPAVFEALRARETRLVDDNNDPTCSYRTYCSVPVYVGTSSFGLLTLDSPQPYSITERERSILELFAGMLAAGLVDS
jgi:hypothetical protein